MHMRPMYSMNPCAKPRGKLAFQICQRTLAQTRIPRKQNYAWRLSVRTYSPRACLRRYGYAASDLDCHAQAPDTRYPDRNPSARPRNGRSRTRPWACCTLATYGAHAHAHGCCIRSQVLEAASKSVRTCAYGATWLASAHPTMKSWRKCRRDQLLRNAIELCCVCSEREKYVGSSGGPMAAVEGPEKVLAAAVAQQSEVVVEVPVEGEAPVVVHGVLLCSSSDRPVQFVVASANSAVSYSRACISPAHCSPPPPLHSLDTCWATPQSTPPSTESVAVVLGYARY